MIRSKNTVTVSSMKSIGSRLLTEIVLYVDRLQGSLLILLQTTQKDLYHKKPPSLRICDNKMPKDLPQVQVMVRTDRYGS